MEGHDVVLNLSSRGEYGADNWLQNRIALKAESVSISTTKNVISTPLPFTGIAFGEAQNVAIDLGVSAKAISLNGIITDQNIHKRFSATTDAVTKFMTAHEVAQLIHAYVDSSFMQEQQNLNSIIVLIPSRVDTSYAYHAGVDENTDVDDCPQIPFTYKVRGGAENKTYDAKQKGGFGKQLGSWPDIVANTGDSASLAGFIRSFSTTINAGQPFIEFNLDFEVAINPMTER